MTSEQAIKSLSPAQRRLYERLQKTRDPDGIYLSRLERRTFSVLRRMGWAEVAPVNGIGVYGRLTDLGKLIAGPIAFVLTPPSEEAQP